MIVTLTANPSVDRTVELDGPLSRGAVHRVTRATRQAGGKGVNISRAAVSAGLRTVAVFPSRAEDVYVRELAAAGIDCRPVLHEGDLRVNITVTEPDGTTTKLNSPGPDATPELLEGLAAALLDLAPEARWTVLAGSLPPGAPVAWYADLVAPLREAGTLVAVDTSDAPLAALVEALPRSAPDLLKPNGEELASIAGADVRRVEVEPAVAAEAARRLVDQGVGAVLATLGGSGAVLVTAEGAWHATPPPTTVVSTVGAGDSALFGYLRGETEGLAPPDRLALAVAYGSAAASLPGTSIPHPGQVHPDRVVVTEVLTISASPSRP